MKSVLSIAGSDSSGGAGIQADIKTITAHKLFAQTAITALTAQNTTGVFGVQNIEPALVRQQIEVVFDDIRPNAVKIGMVSSPEIVETIADTLQDVGAEHIVVDPVMVATSGSALIVDDAIAALIDRLLPLAEVATPNMAEAEALAGIPVQDDASMVEAGRAILRMGAANVLVKGGHRTSDANDVLVTSPETEEWLQGARVDTTNTHGTGCTLSSAIACGLAQGLSTIQAVQQAKQYLTGALKHDLRLGKGSGPVNHMWQYMESN